MSITQIIHPQSNARFTSSRPSPFILCTGDVAHVPVTLTGSGPWKLEYEIMFGNQKTRYAVDHIDGSGGGNGNGEYVIATPPLNRGGQYVIGLTGKQRLSFCFFWIIPHIQTLSLSLPSFSLP